MNSEELLLQSQYFALNGYALTVEEKTALQSSLVLLKTQNHFHRVNYFGKIYGVDRDYHIAQGFADSIVGGNSNKKFYRFAVIKENSRKRLIRARGVREGEEMKFY